MLETYCETERETKHEVLSAATRQQGWLLALLSMHQSLSGAATWQRCIGIAPQLLQPSKPQAGQAGRGE